MTKPLYDADFYLWTQMQTAALRAKDVGALDLEYLAEEIESLGKHDRRAVESYLEVILLHLLKGPINQTGAVGAGRRVCSRPGIVSPSSCARTRAWRTRCQSFSTRDILTRAAWRPLRRACP